MLVSYFSVIQYIPNTVLSFAKLLSGEIIFGKYNCVGSLS